MTFAVFTLYALLAHGARRLVLDSPPVRCWLQRGFAALFAGLGLRLALAER